MQQIQIVPDCCEKCLYAAAQFAITTANILRGEIYDSSENEKLSRI